MTHKQARLSFALRLLLLAAIGLGSTACYFDGHGGCHRPRFCIPVHFCR